MRRKDVDYTQNHHTKPQRRYSRRFIIAVILTLVAFSGLGIYYHIKSSSALPSNIQKAAKFTLYYPTSSDYKLLKDSSKYENGIVFYSLEKGENSIRVSEQAIPDSPPDLANIQGFKKLSTFAGDVAVGSNNGQPTAILLTNTTLISITGTKKVPQDVIVEIAQKMSSLSSN